MKADVFNSIVGHLCSIIKQESKYISLDDKKLPVDISLFRDDFVAVKKKIAFVDGGNGEIFCAPNVSVQFIRVYGSIFEGRKRVRSMVNEFFVVVSAKNKDNKIVYDAKTFDCCWSLTHEFEFDDKTLANNAHHVSPSAVADALRRFAELKLAVEIVEQLNDGDVIVKDGELASRVTFEQQYYDALFCVAKKKNIAVCGFSKTTSLLTDSGQSVVVVLNQLNSNAPWYYFPEQLSDVKTGFVKLSPHNKYVFRVDLFNSDNIQNIVSLLLENSQDPAFWGYPYGLVDADCRACVSEKERLMLKWQFFARSGERFKAHSSALDAHDLLNELH